MKDIGNSQQETKELLTLLMSITNYKLLETLNFIDVNI